MRIKAIGLLAACLLMPAMLVAQTGTGEARNNAARGAAAAGIVGLAVGAIIADSINRDKRVYGPPPPVVYAPPPPFSPAPSVLCYPDQRACYYDGRAYSADWTWRVFGSN
ncbi:hypothetical protein [Ancylobacter sp.]|uniref:hypothetical protein n=1 Tax=Ancylobacter sp. TaxID=1872567 RepID=UPI003D0BE318